VLRIFLLFGHGLASPSPYSEVGQDHSTEECTSVVFGSKGTEPHSPDSPRTGRSTEGVLHGPFFDAGRKNLGKDGAELP